MMKTLKLMLWALAFSLLPSCASNIRTTVTSYSEDPALPAGTVKIEPAASDKPDPLEFEFFASELGRYFQQAGFEPVSSGASNYVARLHYEVQRQQADDSRNRTQFVTGFGFYGRHLGSTMVFDPENDTFEYLRLVELQISKAGDANSKPVAMIRAVSTGKCENLVSVYSEMLQAIFKNLHRKSGSVVTVAVPTSKPCSEKE